MINMLFLASNPNGTQILQLRDEAEEIAKKLSQADLEYSFHFLTEFHVRKEDLEYHLLRHRPHIVHFSGHGNPGGEIILEDEGGNAETVPPDALNNSSPRSERAGGSGAWS